MCVFFFCNQTCKNDAAFCGRLWSNDDICADGLSRSAVRLTARSAPQNAILMLYYICISIPYHHFVLCTQLKCICIYRIQANTHTYAFQLWLIDGRTADRARCVASTNTLYSYICVCERSIHHPKRWFASSLKRFSQAIYTLILCVGYISYIYVAFGFCAERKWRKRDSVAHQADTQQIWAMRLRLPSSFHLSFYICFMLTVK